MAQCPKYPKYYVQIDEHESFLSVAVGEKIVVKGAVYTSKLVPIPGWPGKSGWGPDQPAANGPEISCDIHGPAAGGVRQCIETKRFTPGLDGKFSFEIDTASYAPSMYYLWVFYSAKDGEKPDDLVKKVEEFFVLDPQTAAEIKKFADAFKQLDQILGQKKPTP